VSLNYLFVEIMYKTQGNECILMRALFYASVRVYNLFDNEP